MERGGRLSRRARDCGAGRAQVGPESAARQGGEFGGFHISDDAEVTSFFAIGAVERYRRGAEDAEVFQELLVNRVVLSHICMQKDCVGKGGLYAFIAEGV